MFPCYLLDPYCSICLNLPGRYVDKHFKHLSLEGQAAKREQFRQLEEVMPSIQVYYAGSFKDLAAGIFDQCQKELLGVRGPGFGDLNFDSTCEDPSFLLHIAPRTLTYQHPPFQPLPALLVTSHTRSKISAIDHIWTETVVPGPLACLPHGIC